MESNFYYEITLHRDAVDSTVVAPWVQSLQLGISTQQLTNPVAVLPATEGRQSQGLYLWDGLNWRFGVPYESLTQSVIRGDAVDVYYSMVTPVAVSPSAQIWRNGLLWTTGSEILAGDNAVWVVQTRPSNGLVASVNGIGPDQFGDVEIGIPDIPGLEQALANAGRVQSVNSVQPDSNGNVLINIADIPNLSAELSSKIATINGIGPDPSGNVTLDIPGIATTTTAGIVKVPTGGGLLVDGAGNLTLDTAALPVYVQSVKATTQVGGYTLINDDGSVSHAALLKQLVPGANITITSDANGITINSTSTPPGVEGLIAVQSEGNGTSLVDSDGTTTGIATLKSIEAGTGITITPSGDGKTLTLASSGGTGTVQTVNGISPDGAGNIALTAANIPGLATVATTGSYNDLLNKPAPYSLPVSTASILGGVKIGSGINVTVDGTISNGYVLPIASTTILGGVKQGSNITIAADGTISAVAAYTLPPATTTTLGGIIVGSGLNVDSTGLLTAPSQGVSAVTSVGTGISLVNTAGGSGSPAALKSVAAGSNITVVQDAGQQTITIAASGVVTSVNGHSPTAGAVTIVAADITGFATVATTGSYNDLLNKPAAYTLPAATTTTLGGVIVGSGLTVDGTGKISTTGGYTLPAATASALGGVKIGANVTVQVDGTISVAAPYTLPAATGAALGGIIVGSGLSVTGGGTLSVVFPGSVSSITAGSGPATTGAITFVAGSNIAFDQTGNSITINGSGGFVTDAPNDGNQYGRQNQSWTLIPSVGSAITSVTGQTGPTGTISLVEDSPPANSAIIKSILAGTNVTLVDNAGVITISAAVPGTPVQSVNGVTPDGAGNVTLTAASVGALPTAGGQMAGNIDMQGTAKSINNPTPTNSGDAVPLGYLSTLAIDSGTF
jgi:hypothetical protein